VSRARFLSSSTVFVLLRRGDTVFMLRRHGAGWMDGHFSLPADRVETNETLAQAAVREAREEVGVRVDARDLRLVHILHAQTQGEVWTGHFFEVKVWDGEPDVRERDKHDQPRWVTLDDLPEPMVPYVREALQGVQAGRVYAEYGWQQVPAEVTA